MRMAINELNLYIHNFHTPFQVSNARLPYQARQQTEGHKLAMGSRKHLEGVQPVQGDHPSQSASQQEVPRGRDCQRREALIASAADEVLPIDIEDMQAQVCPGVGNQHARPWRYRQQRWRCAIL